MFFDLELLFVKWPGDFTKEVIIFTLINIGLQKFFFGLKFFEIFGVEEVQWYAKILNLMFEQYFMPNRFCCQYFILVHCDNASPNSMNRHVLIRILDYFLHRFCLLYFCSLTHYIPHSPIGSIL